MTQAPPMRIAYLTAGAAGMYCGSCLHDNALAKALIRRGHDTLLIPTYTPILTDEEGISSDQLFYGGLNVYLQQVSPIFRWIPNWADQFLSSPRLVGWVASKAMGTSAKNLGGLTVSMLKGSQGKQRKEVRRLCDWLETIQPDVVIFSNLLIAGCIPEIQQRLKCPVVVVLQGDDIFYDSLTEPFRSQALVELRRIAQRVDLFIVHSDAYSRRMQDLLGYSDENVAVNHLSIDINDFAKREIAPRSSERAPTVGYLARLAPEKGLHLLIDAFIELHQCGRMPDARLEIAGWLGKQHQAYWQEQQQKISAAGLQHAFHYHGSVDRQAKLEFLDSIDVLCVPTTYSEPKGLFVLEGMAAGVPYILPAHGAFPELHQRASAGHLFTPDNVAELCERLGNALSDLEALRKLGELGRQYVFENASTSHEAERLEVILTQLIEAKKVL